VFAALVPPEPVLDHLALALGAVVPRRAGSRSPLQPRSNWHITLAFFGSVPDGAVGALAEDFRSVVSRCPPFTLELAGAGTFGSKLAWVGVGGEADKLRALMSDVGDLWPRPHEDRPNQTHRPHLTISRGAAQAGLRDPVSALTVYRGPSWTVQSAVLMESQLGQGVGGHSHYVPITAAALSGR
jgi:2'-5' RNA ligase